MPWAEPSETAIPIVGAAIHDGHAIREDLQPYLALTDAERLHEEDPFTAYWTNGCGWRVVGQQSRFEYDLNRPPEKAIYLHPQDCWGLRVWRRPLPRPIIRDSLLEYYRFHNSIEKLLTELVHRFGRVVVLDLHSYNHHRQGPDTPPDDPESNPEINIGTGTMNRRRWSPLVDHFVDDLSNYDYLGRHLDVRENVRFQGGDFPRWIHSRFPESVCCLAVEVKKFFMDEWTGAPDFRQVAAIAHLTSATIPGLLEELDFKTPVHA